MRKQYRGIECGRISRLPAVTVERVSRLRRGTIITGLCLLGLLAAPFSLARAQSTSAPRGTLQIYFIDVGGGQATLFVAPDHHSLLVDTGFSDNNDRDAKRIVAAAKQAGLTHLDYVLITHYHIDHVGGVPQLAAAIPIGTFLDHGPDREKAPVRGWQSTLAGYNAYQKVLATGKYKHVVLHAGEKLPVKGFDATVVSADGSVIDHPLPGAGAPNPTCGAADAEPAGLDADMLGGEWDMSENARAVAIVIRFGRVRILDPGDLTWDRERLLMCPNNKLGHINIFVVGNHGSTTATSPALLYGIAPQVAVMDNGARKGGSIRVMDLIRNAPFKPALWQLHYAERLGDHNTEPALIANIEAPVGRGPSQILDKGYMLKVTVNRDGHFSVLNERTQKSKEYIANK